jgi:hypothetical protein
MCGHSVLPDEDHTEGVAMMVLEVDEKFESEDFPREM